MTQAKTLRRGWSTGACAAAAARAAYGAMLTGTFPDPVGIRLPGGEKPRFRLALREFTATGARAGVVKDAGDDPDVTHGALVIVELRRNAMGAGLSFHAGEGVGTVTRPGLPLAVGEPAINPGPRAMIERALGAAQRDAAFVGPLDLAVTVVIPGGEALAARTMNARLGIQGGLSVLGTTGIVIPYSCASWIHAIHRGVDVARAAGITHVAAATGSTSERAVQQLLGLPEVALIDMGDFAGALLKYLRRHPVSRLTLAGGVGKMAKLAQGHLDLHSERSRLDPAALATDLADIDMPPDALQRAKSADSAAQMLAELPAEPAALLLRRIADRARETALATLAGDVGVDVLVFDRAGRLLARSLAID
jgi:cobalt-precorrin-5B (C1)-methyltransferase